MGFTIMLQLCARVLLTTRPGRTVVVLEFAPAPEPALEPAGGSPDASRRSSRLSAGSGADLEQRAEQGVRRVAERRVGRRSAGAGARPVLCSC